MEVLFQSGILAFHNQIEGLNGSVDGIWGECCGLSQSGSVVKVGERKRDLAVDWNWKHPIPRFYKLGVYTKHLGRNNIKK